MSHQSQTDKRFQNISEAKNADRLELLLLLLLMVSDISLSEFHFKVCEQFVRRLKRPEVSGTASSLVRTREVCSRTVVCLTSAVFGEVELQDVGAEVGQVVERLQMLL